MDGFIGEIRIMPLDYVPEQWLACDGSTQQVQQYQALFAIIGNRFGGDGKKTFALPDLRGRIPVGAGVNPSDPFGPSLADKGGATNVVLTNNEMPPHTHELNTAFVAQSALVGTAQGNWLAELVHIPASGASENAKAFVPPVPSSQSVQVPIWKEADGPIAILPPGAAPEAVALNKGTLNLFGAGGAHENRQPYVGLAYFICHDGEFPVPH